MITEADDYFVSGCGRCANFATPKCKIHNWQEALNLLRGIVLSCGLKEQVKWGHPCYTYDDKNVVLIHSFKAYCGLLFHKGVLLKDEGGVLIQQTENIQSARQVRFTHVNEVRALETTLKAYIYEAIEVEKSGQKVKYKTTDAYDFPEELLEALENDSSLKAAFEALTPGRQRGYLLHFSQAKQSKTREARIVKAMPRIFEGKGYNER